MDERRGPEDRGLIGRVGPFEVDWPRTIGYFGGVAVATAFGVIEPPVGLFIAAIPFVKMLNRPEAPRPVRFAAEVYDGAARPVGGDAPSTITLVEPLPEAARRRPSIWAEARQIAAEAKGRA